MKIKNGFSLIEMVVVIVVVAVVLVIWLLMSPRRELARMVHCASQLSTLGKAFYTYQAENRDINPVTWNHPLIKSGKIGSNQPKSQGTSNNDTQSSGLNPDDHTSIGSFGMGLYNLVNGMEFTRWANPDFIDWDQQPTIGSCLYLLVRTQNIHPITFVCPSAPNNFVMSLEDAQKLCKEKGWKIPHKWEDLNDFHSMVNLSYSYNDPWTGLLDSSASALQALMADKSPAYDTETGVINKKCGQSPLQNPDGSWHDNGGKNFRHGNSNNHGTKAQNVLFGDTHVKKSSAPTVAVQNDNIFTHWTSEVKHDNQIGRWDLGHAYNNLDSYLGN